MNLGHVVIVAVVLAAATSALAGPGADDLAQAYNVRGMDFYHQRQYDSAETWFRAALGENPDHGLANYNLACVLSLKLSRDHWSWHFGPGQGDPFAQLARAIALDPAAAQKAAQDPDFMNIRLTPQFQAMIGADLRDSSLIRTLLIAQGEWFGIACGSWCGNDLLFSETGRVWKRVYAVNEKGQDVLEFVPGEYSVSTGVVTIRFSSGEVLEGYFDDKGALQTGSDWRSRYLVHPPGDI
jgi:hypothetical protein